ncbi:carboxymuconolactone decarboxylase family protein [Clostridium sp. DL1XJH146]
MSKEFNKRIFTTGEFYHIVDSAISSAKNMRKAEKQNLISKELKNHVMLAVTEVNGCQLCSYKHTKDALEMGMSEEDIQGMLSGILDNIKKDEAIALFFAQHYAESKGNYDASAWQRLVDTYGEIKAQGILAVTKIITMGNAHGIALGSLKNRLTGKAVKNSKLYNELGIAFGILLFLPISAVKNLFR